MLLLSLTHLVFLILMLIFFCCFSFHYYSCLFFLQPYENATTMWERFSAGADGGSSSHNHHMFSPIGSWFISHLAGLRLNGLETITVQPRWQHNHTLLSRVEAEFHTAKGKVEVNWRIDPVYSSQRAQINVTVPLNAAARFIIEAPIKGHRCLSLRANDRPLGQRDQINSSWKRELEAESDFALSWREEDEVIVIETGSGVFSFDTQWHRHDVSAKVF